MKFGVPQALWWVARATEIFVNFLCSEFHPSYTASVCALRVTILCGHDDHPRPLPNHGTNNLIYPSFLARGSKVHIFRPKLESILRQLPP